MSKKYPKLNDEEWVRQQYCIKKLTPTKIAHIINCSDFAVRQALKRLGIPMRTKEEAVIKYFEPNNKEWLEKEYLVKKLHPRQIAEIVGCSASTVRGALKRFGIKTRSISECKKGEMHPFFGKHSPMYGRHHSEETKVKQSNALKGEKNPMYGRRGKENHRYGKYPSEETKEKMREGCKHRVFPKIDTKPELIFIDFYNKFGIAERVKDTRDNSFHIGRLNPDFIIPDMKIAIFINGDYWHSPLLNYKLKFNRTVNGQIKICKRHRWVPVTIWETDLLREDADAFVLHILKEEGII